MIKRQRAIIGSMTKVERKKPDILQASRKRRIAAGAGVEVAEVNRLLKQHRQMQDAFKFMAKDGGKSFARMAGMMGGGGMDRLKQHGRRQGARRRCARRAAARPHRRAARAAGPSRPGRCAPARVAARPGRRRGFNPFKKP